MNTSPVRECLIKALADGQFHSGEMLGATLGISRAAVSRHVRSLRELGLEIFSVTGKGYRLQAPLVLLDQQLIRNHLPEQLQPDEQQLQLFSVIGSTNQYLLERHHELPSGSYVLAETQTAGRGRRGRQWHSPFGSHIYLSALWRFDCPAASLMGLSLAVGVAVVRALESLGYNGVELKWPNDLLWQGRKLGGILVELEGQAGGSFDVIAGLGLNIAMPPVTEEVIDQPWADLSQIMPGTVDRNQLAARLIAALHEMAAQFEQHGLSSFEQDWQRLDHFRDRRVCLQLGKRSQMGIVRGINSQGALMLEADGEIKAWYGGEITMRAAS